SETAGPVVVPPAIQAEGVVGMVRAIECRTLPQRPVEAFGNGRTRLVILLPSLRPERTVRPVVHFADGADRAAFDPRGEQMAVGCVAVGEQMRGGGALAARLQRAMQLVRQQRDGLVRDRRLALLQRRDV